MFNDNPQTLIDQLRTDLLKARKARDQLTSTTLQGVISAIDNAGAVPAPENTVSIGVGSTEATRRELSKQDLQMIIQGELVELEQAIKELDDRENTYTNELRNRITILESYL
ncbi:MAG TPA: hypothetical protein VLG36_01785 [Candidatus Chromulinivoraceae bacterium]|nr:hypothetical protein [Candidatus Chromulinivoraceae bacterium]